MTFSSPHPVPCLLALALLLGAPLAWAGLGEPQSSIDGDGTRMHARHSVVGQNQYAVHELTKADGSRVRQFVARNGRVFAVSWNTLAKPDLSVVLGGAFPSYQGAAHAAARQGGIQRQLRHEGSDLVVQSSGHLHVYQGYAYRPSLLPQGLTLQTLGLG